MRSVVPPAKICLGAGQVDSPPVLVLGRPAVKGFAGGTHRTGPEFAREQIKQLRAEPDKLRNHLRLQLGQKLDQLSSTPSPSLSTRSLTPTSSLPPSTTKAEV